MLSKTTRLGENSFKFTIKIDKFLIRTVNMLPTAAQKFLDRIFS